MRLRDKLKEIGINMGEGEFIDRIHDLWFSTIPAITVDEFLCTLRVEKEFCDSFRQAHRLMGLDGEAVEKVILSTILNERKKGFFGRHRKGA